MDKTGSPPFRVAVHRSACPEGPVEIAMRAANGEGRRTFLNYVKREDSPFCFTHYL